MNAALTQYNNEGNKKHMTSVLFSCLALFAAIGLLGQDTSALNEEVLHIAGALTASTLGAGAVVYFRPEPTVKKAFIKAMWSAAFGLIFGWTLNDIFMFDKESFRIAVYSVSGLCSLMFLQSIMLSMEKLAPRVADSIAERGAKIFGIFGGSPPEKESDRSKKNPGRKLD